MSVHTQSRPWLGVRIFRFYRDGFRSMTLGRTLWAIIGIKLFVFFFVLKMFFFPNFLATRFATDQQRAAHVIDQLTPPVLGYTQPVQGE